LSDLEMALVNRRRQLATIYHIDADIGRSSASMIWIPPLSFGRTPVFRRITAVPVLAHGCTTPSTAGISTRFPPIWLRRRTPEGVQTGPRAPVLVTRQRGRRSAVQASALHGIARWRCYAGAGR